MNDSPRSRVAPLGRIAALPVRFYRRWISPLKPPTCRFHPTCSAYALEALELHGVLRGGWLSVWRVLRCQPLCKGGFDPVPDSTRHAPLESTLHRPADPTQHPPRDACESPADVDTPGHEPNSPYPDPSAPSRSSR